MYDEARILACQKEIRRLRGVVGEQNEETRKLKRLVQCMAKGVFYEGTDIERILVIGGAGLDLHELLKEVLEEELM